LIEGHFINGKRLTGSTAKSNTNPSESAGVCTNSLKITQHFKRQAAAGLVMINAATADVDYHVPFGGVKGSNYGPREQASYAREFYTTVKTVYVA
jgi:alpha-ketoglutaric semialdehyde dehydrogenase